MALLRTKNRRKGIAAVAVLMLVAVTMAVAIPFVSDSSDAAASRTATITCNTTVGNSITESANPMSSTGMMSNYVSNDKPDWITITKDLKLITISGTPTSPGTYSFKITGMYTEGIGRGQYEVNVTINVSAVYNLTFASNGGSEISGLSYTGSETSHTFTIPSASPTKSGNTFAGWATWSDATSAEYAPGSEFALNSSSPNAILYAVWNVIDLTVSDITVLVGSGISITPVTTGTVTVSGVSWLSASGNVVFGTAPSTAGEYTVTVSCEGVSESFTITVISALAFTNVPSSGIFAYEG